MRKIMSVVAMVLLAVTARAQTQVATVTSSAAFTLRGAGITPGQGIPMWPVLAGDNITAGNAMAIVTYPDGSVITLTPGSEGRIDLVNGQPSFQLLSDTAHYSVKSKNAVALFVLNHMVDVTSLSGTLTIGRNRKVGGAAWTGGQIAAAAILGGVAAAGLGVAVAKATGGGPAVSPSR
jgi:hypothetical protein